MKNHPITIDQYILTDYPRTLFPLKTTSVLVKDFSEKLREYVYNGLFASKSSVGFPVQQRCYAAKRGYNLRRTVKLDPAAEFFVYDIVLKNRKTFRRDHRANRTSYGYRFANGNPESVLDGYAQFRSAIASARQTQPLTLKVDVATYFNSIYHHDIVNTVRDISWPEQDAELLGRFLREINAGRSVDCLPQGIHPCKVLGSELLRFIDNSIKLKSQIGIRFLDDMHFFDSSEQVLQSDLVTLQELLGEKGLSLNDAKSSLGRVEEVDLPRKIDGIKRSLLKVRRQQLSASGEESEEEVTEQIPLSGPQIEYLLHLLQTPDIEESDAELVLVLLRDNPQRVFERMLGLLSKYPGLTKAVYRYARLTQDRSELDVVVRDFLQNSPSATEYQLFWLASLAEDLLRDSPHLGDIFALLLDHPRATTVSRAKVFEIDDRRFGLPELRAEVLRSGKSDWEAWAAAVGSRCMAAAGRNYLLAYFAKASPLNNLVAECIRQLP